MIKEQSGITDIVYKSSTNSSFVSNSSSSSSSRSAKWSLSLRKKGGSVFGDRGQRFARYPSSIGTILLNCACVINTNTHVVMNTLKAGL